jgi:hypothetical protein
MICIGKVSTKASPVAAAKRRSPMWRWNLVKELVAKGAKNHRFDGPVVGQTVRYLCLKGNDRASHEELSREFPEIFEADQINSQPSGDRWTIEALIVARESNQKIASYLGMDEEVVDTYEHLFFDVRDRLDAKGYVNTQLLRNTSRGMDPTDPDVAWKAIAYIYGAKVAYAWMNIGEGADSIEELRKITRTQSAKKSAMASLGRPVNFDHGLIIETEMNIQKLEHEREAAGTGKVQGEEADAARSLLGSIGLMLADPNAPAPQSAFEPRAASKFSDQLAAAGVVTEQEKQ